MFGRPFFIYAGTAARRPSQILFFLILHSLHPLQGTAGAEPAVHERVPDRRPSTLHVCSFRCRAQIFHHAIRLKHVAANWLPHEMLPFSP